MWVFLGVAKISNNFLGCLKFLIFFGVNGRCWVRAYVCIKNESTPPPLRILAVFLTLKTDTLQIKSKANAKKHDISNNSSQF